MLFYGVKQFFNLMDNIITLKKYAVSYLSKYNSSKSNLIRILHKKIRKMNLEKKDKFFLYSSVNAILNELESKNYINDCSFANAKIHRFSLEGKSKNFIKNYLFKKGIDKNLIEESLANYEIDNPKWETESAKIFARKKRLGAKHSNRSEKDLAKMARAGFNYKIIKEILGIH